MRVPRLHGPLTVDELSDAEVMVLRQVQRESYREEVLRARKGEVLPSSSKILPISPVLGSDGLLRGNSDWQITLLGKLDTLSFCQGSTELQDLLSADYTKTAIMQGQTKSRCLQDSGFLEQERRSVNVKEHVWFAED